MSKTDIVHIEKTEHNGVAWTSPDGKRHEYDISPQSVWLEVQDIFKIQSVEGYGNDRLVRPLITRYFGKATLDRSIEIIGFPDTRTITVDVEFREFDEKFAATSAANRGEDPPEEIQPGILGYSVYSGGGWYLLIQLSSSHFQALSEAFEMRNVARIAAGVSSSKLYVKDWRHPKYNEDHFMAPDESGATHAWCRLKGFVLGSPTFNVCPIEPVKDPVAREEGEAKEKSTSGEDSIETSAVILSGKLESIARSLTVLIFALFAIAAVLLMKG